MPRHSKTGFAFVLALLFGFAGGAQATSFDLGNVSGPGTLSVGNNKDVGPFTDHYFFTIDPAVSLIFSALVTNDTWRHGGIYDMDGTLSDASGTILNGDATTIYFPPPYPVRQVNFLTTLLGPGRYNLSIFGTSSADVLAPNDYSGTITLAATPLPPALFLMLTALGALGWFGRRRIGTGETSAAV